VKILAIIPARGGSQRLPGKNLTSLGGKPLIDWSIEAARDPRISWTYVSTDDEAIAARARTLNVLCDPLRPKELAGHESPVADAVLLALKLFPEATHVLLLQPTSPLRSVVDVKAAIDLLEARQGLSLTSVVATSQRPEHLFYAENELVPVLGGWEGLQKRTQDLRTAYALNGALYLVERNHFERTRRFVDEGTIPYVMPAERSVDIDEESDLRLAEFYKSESIKLR